MNKKSKFTTLIETNAVKGVYLERTFQIFASPMKSRLWRPREVGTNQAVGVTE